MRPVSPAFLDAIRRPHRQVCRVDVLDRAHPVAVGLPVIEGSIVQDRTALARRTLTCTIAGNDWTPLRTSDLLAPYGNELRIWLGIEIGPDIEWSAQGLFRIDSATPSDGGTTKIEATDRSAWVSDRGLDGPYQQQQTKNVPDAFRSLLGPALPSGTQFIIEASGAGVGGFLVTESQNVWQVASDLAEGLACELFFDGDGRLVLRDEATVTNNPPVWEIDDGPNGVLVGAEAPIDRRKTFNYLALSGENVTKPPIPAVPWRVVSADLNPASATWIGSKFGINKRTETTDIATDATRGQRMADTILQRQLGKTQSVSFTNVPNPALEVGDVVRIIRRELLITEVHIIDTLTTSLSPQAAQIGKTRAQVFAS